MSKFLFVNLIDRLFISVCLFLSIFAWINFYTRSLWVSFVFSLIFSSACLFIIFYILTKKKNKVITSKKKAEQINACFLSFRLMKLDDQLNLLKSLLTNQNATIFSNMIFYEKENKKHAIIISTQIECLTENDFFNIVQTSRNLDIDVVEIICKTFANFNTKILNNKTFNLISQEKLFVEFFEKFNTYPKLEDLDTNSIKTNFLNFLSKFFMPHKAKAYFVCGLILIFSSIIIPYHAYYVVFGSMLLLFAVICKIKNSISG